MTFGGQNRITYVIWAVLIVAFSTSLVVGRWSMAFISLATLVLSILPVLLVERFDIQLPVSFLAAIVGFAFATVFLGEALDFYERYWWWDVALHGGSAIGFGLLGYLFVFMLFEGDRYAAPPIAIAMIAYSMGMTMGVLWEVFEFIMDQAFGTNMQKSGLHDTMWDLIVDMIGAGIGSLAGFFHLKGREFGGLSGALHEFIRLNKRLYRRFDKD